MEQLSFSRRQILKAAGAAGGLVAASSLLNPAIFLADDGGSGRSVGRFGPWGRPSQIAELASDPTRGDYDFHPAISRDELSLYFTTTRFGPVPQPGKALPPTAIAVVHRADRNAPWDVPTPRAYVAALNYPGKSTGVPNLTPDGHVMYFQSGRSDPDGHVAPGHGHLWFSYRQHTDDDDGAFGWETPEPVPGDLNTTSPSQLNQAAATYFRNPAGGDPRMYYAQFDGAGSFGDPNQDWDIYVSYQNQAGRFGAGTPVAALEPDEPGELTERDVKPWSRQTRTAIRRDGREIFITSNRRGGLSYTNPATPIENLWVATRRDVSDEKWDPPTLIENVNSGFGEGGPALSWDGRTLYFFSARPTLPGQTAQPHNWQLWMTTRERLED